MEVRYFWNQDPGEGAGTALDLACAVSHECLDAPDAQPPPRDYALLEVPLDCGEIDIPEDLTAGHHILFLRARKEGGEWGPVCAVPCEIPRPADLAMVGGEWFLDLNPDPGRHEAPPPGEGNRIDRDDMVIDCAELLADDTGWFDIELPDAAVAGAEVLEIGFRLLDSQGVWGPVRWERVAAEVPEEPLSVCVTLERWVDHPVSPHWGSSSEEEECPVAPDIVLDAEGGGWFSGDVDEAAFLAGSYSVRATGHTGDASVEWLNPVPPPPALFTRGDADSSGAIDLSDGIGILSYLYLGSAAPACMDAADTDDSGGLDMTDAIGIFSWLFLGGAPPNPPAPSQNNYSSGDCGLDPTPQDALGCEAPSAKCQGK